MNIKVKNIIYLPKWFKRESDEPIIRRNEMIIDGRVYPKIKVEKETNLTSPSGE